MSDCVNFDPATLPEHDTCPAVGYQKAGICVPVTVMPFAHTGEIKMKCCGEPTVVASDKPCAGQKNGSCTFTISQTICVAVPVDFGATVTVGDTYVDCLGTSSCDICASCRTEEESEL